MSESLMGRLFDVFAVVAVAIVLMLPKATVEASPALDPEVTHKIERDRVAALEDALFAAPDDVGRAVALGDAYLRLMHPDWTLAVLARFSDGKADHRVQLLEATARAERLEPQRALDAVKRGLAVCDAEGEARCPAAERTRFSVIASGMQALVDKGIDPRKQPKEAREAVGSVLHAAKASDKMGPPAPSAAPKKK
jgi:hypothetical protein